MSDFPTMNLFSTSPPLSTSMPPSSWRENRDVPRKGFTGVEVGVITVAVAVTLVTSCLAATMSMRSY